MKSNKFRASIVAALVSMSLLGLTGFGAVDGLRHQSNARNVWCC
jgi:hypothetical protein